MSHRASFRRFVVSMLVLTVLAALAAVATVATAWVIACRYPRHYTAGQFEQFELETAEGWVCGDKSRAAGIEVWNVWSGKRPKSSVALPNAATLTELSAWGRPPTDGFAWCSSTATGWPFPCFVKHYEVTELRPDRLGALTARDRALTVMAVSQLRRWTGALVWNPGSYSETAFPVVPLWGPLLADWGIFTAALLLPVLAVRFVVVLRRKPWRCPSCGYDRRGLAAAVKCPECGTVPAAG